MSREIKFRQFAKGKMFYWGFNVAGDGSYFTGPVSGGGVIPDVSNQMQFTGLHDVNGVEIYEGDIVKWDDCSKGRYWRVAVVKIDPSLNFHCFDCPAIENSSAHGHRFHYGNFIYTDTHNHLTVIGNIYEHPHLLDDAK